MYMEALDFDQLFSYTQSPTPFGLEAAPLQENVRVDWQYEPKPYSSPTPTAGPGYIPHNPPHHMSALQYTQCKYGLKA